MSTSFEPCLQLKNIEKYYHVNARNLFQKNVSVKILDDISLDIEQGEIFGLVGESGCGKSTLGRIITGLIDDATGSILYEGQDLFALSHRQRRKLSRNIQIVFQDPYSSLNPKKRIGWILEEPLKIHRLGNRQRRREIVDEILLRIGLDLSYYERFPNELSGGQRQRVSIGYALMLNPKLIVADEPVSALDVSVQAQILNMLTLLNQELGVSILLISHNLGVIYHMCSRVAVMYLGRIVELATVETIYDHPCHPYTKLLLGAIPDSKIQIEWNQQSLEDRVDDGSSIQVDFLGCPFHPRCQNATSLCLQIKPELINKASSSEAPHWVRCHHF